MSRETRLISKGVPSNQMGSQKKRWLTSTSTAKTMYQLLTFIAVPELDSGFWTLS